MMLAAYFLMTSQNNTSEVLDVLRSVEIPVRYAKGCQSAYILQNLDNPQELVVYELWNTKAEMERHMKSQLYKRMFAVFEMCTQKPEIRILEFEHTWGMEWIEKILMPDLFTEIS